MSLFPMLFSSWWEDLERPHRLFDQHFGLPVSVESLPSALSPLDSDILVVRPRRRRQRYQPYDRALTRESSGASTVKADKKNFQVTLDVQQFDPEEVTVKVSGNNVVVEEQCDIDQLKSNLSSDGVLTITAPRKEPETQQNERIVKIQMTGQPAIRDDLKSAEKSEESSTQKSPAQQREPEQKVKAA
ncbi:Protein lethal(2)essential for life [Anthophora quadrimaculata]